jgi:DNA-binding MarR family transcriptional regulator
MYDVVFAPSGLKSTQSAILAELERRSQAKLTIGELADVLVMDPSTLGHNLRPLERDGLIVRQVSLNDRRSKLIGITEAGIQRLKVVQGLWKTAQSQFEKAFGMEAAAAMRAAMHRIADDPPISSVHRVTVMPPSGDV